MLTLAFKDCNTIIILRIIWTSLRNEAATMNTLETAQTHITRFTSHPRPAHPGRPVALRVSRQPRAAGETPARGRGADADLRAARVSDSPRGDCRMQARGV